MTKDDLHFRLRIPESLKAKVQASAEVNRRSMTAEIVARLEASFSVRDMPLSAAQEEAIKTELRGLVQRIDERLALIEQRNGVTVEKGSSAE